MDFEEAPCKIEDCIKMTYSFDNLHKFLNFLLLNDKDYFKKLQHMQIKLLEMQEIKENLQQANLTLENFETKFQKVDSTLNSFFQRFSELDIKISTAVSVRKFYLKYKK
jgi:hypothetical protein